MMIYPIRSIVAAVADLDEHDPVLGSAVELAGRTGAALHLVHAFELPDLMWDAYARMGYMDGEALQQYAEGIRDRMAERVREITTSERVHCHAIAGPPAPMIREIALREEANLVVVGATRRGAVARALLGTTAQRVLRSAPAPVLVVRRPLPPHLQRVLLTTDLSPFSAAIHEAALDVLESVFDGDTPSLRSLLVVYPGTELTPAVQPELLEGLSREAVARFLAERRGRDRTVEGSIRLGEPAREIVGAAGEWDADLLVLGTHARPVPQRWLLGSVAEAAVRSTSSNVLVIPASVEEQRTLPVPVEPLPKPTVTGS
jgi:nucleotide-binding universal stress UspA family protein